MFELVSKTSSVIFLVVVIAAGIVLGVAFIPMGTRAPDVDSYRYLLADRVAEEVARHVVEKTDAERIAVLPVMGDLSGEVTDLLGEAIRGMGPLQLLDPSDVEDARDDHMEGREDKTVTWQDAIDIGKKIGAEGVVMARLDKFISPKRDDPAEIDMAVDMVDVQAAKLVKGERFRDTLDPGFSLTYFAAAMKETSGWLRLLIWVALVAAAPFGTYPLVQAVTKKEKNAYNFAMLAGFTLFDLLLALFLVGFIVIGFWSGFLIFLGFLAGAAYNYIACTIVYEMGK